jgi:uncharacterized protein (DUF1697 family)
MLAMSDLRGCSNRLALTDVRSLLQSGNLVFRCERPGCDGLERLLHDETAKRLGVSVEFFVRSPRSGTRSSSRKSFSERGQKRPQPSARHFSQGIAQAGSDQVAERPAFRDASAFPRVGKHLTPSTPTAWAARSSTERR